MDNKVIISIAATAITLVSAVTTETIAATTGTITATASPTPTTISAGGYTVSNFNFQPSANVQVMYDTGATGVTASDSGMVAAGNMTKGNRTFAGSVGGLSSAPRACQNSNVTVSSALSSPTSAVVLGCTF